MVVLIPKGGGDYFSIGLVEVICKALAVILNRHFNPSITYHDSLHGFRMGCGTGTATLKVKLFQKFLALREAVLHAIFLELHKAYDALDKSRCLVILEVYGMSTRALRLLQRYWERLEIVAQAGGYYRAPFYGEISVTQGDPLSPTIFNVVVDVVVCHWESLVKEQEEVDSSGDKGEGAQMAGGRSWTETTGNDGRRRYTNG